MIEFRRWKALVFSYVFGAKIVAKTCSNPVEGHWVHWRGSPADMASVRELETDTEDQSCVLECIQPICAEIDLSTSAQKHNLRILQIFFTQTDYIR
jgi:hypothetical protein